MEGRKLQCWKTENNQNKMKEKTELKKKRNIFINGRKNANNQN